MRNDRWATENEIIRALNISREEKSGGPILYHDGKRAYEYKGEGHTIYLGVSGSGKSWHGTIPLIRSLIDNGESFVVVDPKGEIYRHTSFNARKSHDIHLIDFRNVMASEKWNPLAMIYDYYNSGDYALKQLAQELTEELAYTIFPDRNERDPFWEQSARRVFSGFAFALLEHGIREEVNIPSINNMMSEAIYTSSKNIHSYIKDFVELLGNTTAAMMLKPLAGLSNVTSLETFESVRSTFLNGISQFIANDGLMHMISTDELNIKELSGDSRTAIYIVLPDESPIYDSIAGILCSQLMNHYVRIAHDKYNGRLPIRMNICLEELGNIGKAVENLPHLMSAGRSRNIRCQLVLQSLSQLVTIYDTSRASTIIANADVWIAYRTNEQNTLKELSLKCGERIVKNERGESKESLITTSQLASLKTGQALVIISGRTRYVANVPSYSDIYEYTLSDTEYKKEREESKIPLFTMLRFIKISEMLKTIKNYEEREMEMNHRMNPHDFIDITTAEMEENARRKSDRVNLYTTKHWDVCKEFEDQKLFRLANILSDDRVEEIENYMELDPRLLIYEYARQIELYFALDDEEAENDPFV